MFRFLLALFLIGFLFFYFFSYNNYSIKENLKKEIIQTRAIIQKTNGELAKLKENIKNTKKINFYEEKDKDSNEPSDEEIFEQVKNSSDDFLIKAINMLEDTEKIIKDNK